MAYSNGLITSPMSIADVQKAYGLSDRDLMTLVKDAMKTPIFQKMALHKPNDYERIDYHYDAQVKGKSNVDNGLGFTYGYHSYGIVKPHITMPVSQLKNGSNGGTFRVTDNGTNTMAHVNSTPSLDGDWTNGDVTVARLHDFKDNPVLAPNYGKETTGLANLPYNVLVSVTQSTSTTLILTVQFYYHYEDLVQNGATYLGVKNLFGLGDKQAYLGVMVFKPLSSSSTTPVCFIGIGSTPIDGSYDKYMGMKDARFLACEQPNAIGSDATTQIPVGSNVTVVPFLAKIDGTISQGAAQSGTFHFIGLQKKQTYKIASSGYKMNSAVISSVTIQIHYGWRDGNCEIYMTQSNVNNSSFYLTGLQSNQRMEFAFLKPGLQILPYGGGSVKTLTYCQMGDGTDADYSTCYVSYVQVSSTSTTTHGSKFLYGFKSYSSPMMVTSGSTVKKVMVGFSYLEKLQTTKNFNGIFDLPTGGSGDINVTLTKS